MTELPMKWRVYLPSFACLLLPLFLLAPARAETASRSEMRAVCRAWLDHRVTAQGSWSGSRVPEIAEEQAVTRGQELLGVAYRIAPLGFILVPAHKELCPILFFCETASLDFTSQEVPAQVLRGRLALATELVEGKAGLSAPSRADLVSSASERNRSLWAQMTERGSPWPSQHNGPAAGVGPLLSTAWHQGAPFNMLCPLGRNGIRCVAGCTPVAAAQIARYHAYPPAGGFGEADYAWPGDDCGYPSSEGALLHADFRDAYDWDHIPGACSPSGGGPADSAAAELCYELGVAGQADFGTNCGTAAMPEQLVAALQQHFGYGGSAVAAYRASCADAGEWFRLLQDEINALRPVLYGFVYVSGGQHSLVCDGWGIDAGIKYLSLNLGGGGITGWYAVDYNGMSDPMQDSAILHLAPPDRVVTVGPSGEGDYPNIQAAIDAEHDRAIVELLDGVFTGAGNRDLDCRGKQITIRSRHGDPDRCVIDCQGSENDQHRAFVFRHRETFTTSIQGITMRNGYVSSDVKPDPALGGAVLCESGVSPIFRNCVFSVNHADLGGAIGCSGSAAPEVETCVFWENSARAGGAFSKTGAGEVQIDGSTLYGNQATKGSALQIGSGGGLILARSIVAGSRVGRAVELIDGGTARLNCCDLYGNEGGDWVGGMAGQLGQDGNISADPLFCNAEAGDLGLDNSSPCTAPECGLMGARPASCGDPVYYVGAAPQYSYHTIAEALAVAAPRCRIVLMDSLYTGAGNRDLEVPCRELTIESAAGDPAACVLDVQGSSAEPHRAFVVTARERVTFRGLTVRNAWASFGSGIFLHNADSTRILNCAFRSCTSTAQGYNGGGAVFALRVAPYRGRLTISDCRFDLCRASNDGGAVGVYNAWPDTTCIDNCTFNANTATRNGGAVGMFGSPVVISNSVFRNNSAESGGAVLTGCARIESCTLVGNAATTMGGSVGVSDCYSGESAITSCIFASSAGRPPIECLYATVSVTCCDFWQNEDSAWTGCTAAVPDPQNRNIFLDPQFCAPQNGDFHLTATSPCAPGQPGHPLCGLIGALPAGCTPPRASVFDESAVSTLSSLRCVPNPFREETRIDFVVPAHVAGGEIEISIYDVGGRRVRTLLRTASESGPHSMRWNAQDDGGRRVGSGVFFCRLRLGAHETIQRMMVLR
jgi:hypothetical protein